MATITGFLADNEGTFIDKDPIASLVYTMNWSQWLPAGQTITTSIWTFETISGDTIPLVNEAASNTTTSASIEISGGSAGKIYKVYNKITTTSGYEDRRYFRIKVKVRSI
jgi:hypothetical protein